MNLHLKRLSLADVRLNILIEMETDLKAQLLELLELRKRVRQAEQARARRPAPVVIAAVAQHVKPAAAGCASGEISAGGVSPTS